MIHLRMERVSDVVNDRAHAVGTYPSDNELAMNLLIPVGGGKTLRASKFDCGRQRHAAFLRQNIILNWVNALSWQEFENLAAEIFRARGYFVENVGGGGAEGGIDLRLSRLGETTLVQCKRWKVFKGGVRPIRKFLR